MSEMSSVVIFVALFVVTIFASFFATPIFVGLIVSIEAMSMKAPSATFGVSVSVIGSLVIFLYTAITQNRKSKGLVRSYRRAEEKLVQIGKLTTEEIVEYHRSYNWHSYAGLAFSTLFIIVALFLEGRLGDRSGVQFAVTIFGLALIACSAVILGIIDLVHTNTLTPLVTADRRFAIINLVIILGGFALTLQICAVGVFLSLINSWLSVLTTGVMIMMMILLTRTRGIPVSSLQAERGLTADEVSYITERQ